MDSYLKVQELEEKNRNLQESYKSEEVENHSLSKKYEEKLNKLHKGLSAEEKKHESLPGQVLC